MRLMTAFKRDAYRLTEDAKWDDARRFWFVMSLTELLSVDPSAGLNAVRLKNVSDAARNITGKSGFPNELLVAYNILKDNIATLYREDSSGNAFLRCGAADELFTALTTFNAALEGKGWTLEMTDAGRAFFDVFATARNTYAGMSHSGLSGVTYVPSVYR